MNAWYRLRESTGSPADSSGNGAPTSNATFGVPTLGVAGPITSDGAATKGISYDGVDDGHQFPDAALLDVGDVFSLELWMKRNETTVTAEQRLLDKRLNAYLLGLLNHKIFFAKGDVAVIVESTNTIQDTNWHHIVATKNGATVKQYCDGIDVTGTVTNLTLADNTYNLFLGNGSSVFWANVVLSEVAIYPTALSANRVLAHYNAAFSSGLFFASSKFPKAKLRRVS